MHQVTISMPRGKLLHNLSKSIWKEKKLNVCIYRIQVVMFCLNHLFFSFFSCSAKRLTHIDLRCVRLIPFLFPYRFYFFLHFNQYDFVQRKNLHFSLLNYTVFQCCCVFLYLPHKNFELCSFREFCCFSFIFFCL